MNHAADVKEVQMLHWWTSGGEAARAEPPKGRTLAKHGYALEGCVSRGRVAEAAMTALEAMVATGKIRRRLRRPPALTRSNTRKPAARRITSLAIKEGWDKVIPKALQKSPRPTASGTPFPVNIHPSTGSGSTKP